MLFNKWDEIENKRCFNYVRADKNRKGKYFLREKEGKDRQRKMKKPTERDGDALKYSLFKFEEEESINGEEKKLPKHHLRSAFRQAGF